VLNPEDLRRIGSVQQPKNSAAKCYHIHLPHGKQSAEGLTHANKLTKAHLNLQNQKTEVRLAVKVLSE